MPSDKPIYRFGRFELDSGKRVLFCEGHPVLLRAKSLEILLVLVESHGELVEKQALMDQVWPETFVEEGNLSFTIHLLRKALGEERNGANRFIETVPRRGYRFVAHVELAKAAQNGLTPTAVDTVAPSAGPETTEEGSKIGAEPMRRRTWQWVAVGAALGLAALQAAIRLGEPPPSPAIVRYVQLTSDARAKFGRLLTDGSRIYFLERSTDGANSIMSVSAAGGDPVAIPVPFPDFTVFDVSPSRSQLLLGIPQQGGALATLWTLPTSGGAPRRLADIAAADAKWSPDAQHMAYATDRDIYLARPDGTDSRKLVTIREGINGLFWFADGRTLRLIIREPARDTLALWDIDANGDGLHPVLHGWKYFADGWWLPHGNFFLFVGRLAIGANYFIYALRSGRGFFERGADAPIQLAPTGPLEFRSQVPSPDGKKIFALGLQHRPELARFDARLSEFVPFLRGIPAYWASLSPDGQSVAYLSLPQHSLWRAKPDGSQPVQLTYGPLEGDGFAWSPDGKQIALRAREQGQRWNIYLIPTEGGVPRPLASTTADQGIPSWSPDGRRIAFGDWPGVEGQSASQHLIHLVNLDTGEMSDLAGSRGLWTARWSPDGRYIAALTMSSLHLRLFDFVNGKWRDLNTPPVSNPTWSHDGKYIFFDSTGASRAIYRERISDGNLNRITTLEGTGATEAWGSNLTPDDSPLITRDLGLTEIYALDVEWP